MCGESEGRSPSDKQRSPGRRSRSIFLIAASGPSVAREEKEGLPIRRLQHDKRGFVFVYSSELDAWRDSRQQMIAAEPAEQPVEAVATRHDVAPDASSYRHTSRCARGRHRGDRAPAIVRHQIPPTPRPFGRSSRRRLPSTPAASRCRAALISTRRPSGSIPVLSMPGMDSRRRAWRRHGFPTVRRSRP